MTSTKAFIAHVAAAILLFSVTEAMAEPAIGRAACATPSDRGAVYPVVHKISNEIRLVQYSRDRAVEQLHGKAALSHLQNLKARRGEAFAESIKNMRSRGYLPTDYVYVERHIRLTGDGTARRKAPYLLTQTYSESNADGEIVFWSWDDGSADTWEGTIYVEIYSDGAATTWDGQINDAVEDHPWIWYQKTWEREPITREKHRISLPPTPGSMRNNGILLASRSARINPDFQLLGWYEWANCWRAAVVGGCTGAAVRCKLAGPGWPLCWGSTCVGIEVGSAITCYMMAY